MDVRPTIRYSETDKQTKNQTDVLQHARRDVRPTQSYPLKQASKQITTETCYTIEVSPITRYTLKQKSKQRNRETCYSMVLGTSTP